MRALNRDHWFARRCRACLLPDNIRRGWDPVRRTHVTPVAGTSLRFNGDSLQVYDTPAVTYANIGNIPISKMTRATFLIHYQCSASEAFARIFAINYNGTDDIRAYFDSSAMTSIICAWDDGSQTNKSFSGLTAGREYILLMSHNGSEQYHAIFDVVTGQLHGSSGTSADTFTFSGCADDAYLFSSPAFTTGQATGKVFSLLGSEIYINNNTTAAQLCREYLRGDLYAKEPDFYPWMAAAAGSQTISTSLIASGEAVNNPTVVRMLQEIAPSLIGSSESVNNPTLAPGAVDIAPGAIASAEDFPTHSITVSLIVAPDHIATGENFYDPVIVVGAVTISPSAIGTSENFFDPIVAAGTLYITDPTLIASGEAFFTHTFTLGAVTISPSHITSGEVFYSVYVDDGTGTPKLLGMLSLLGVGK